jgi:hypothetical protein
MILFPRLALLAASLAATAFVALIAQASAPADAAEAAASVGNGGNTNAFERALRTIGFEPAGEPRRRGDHLVVEGRRSGGLWRIVIDVRTGEIVGLRLIASGTSEERQAVRMR